MRKSRFGLANSAQKRYELSIVCAKLTIPGGYMSAAIPRHKEPSPCKLPRQTIFGLAAQIASQVKYRPGGAIDGVVRALGGSIVYQDIDAWYASEDGSIVVNGVRDFTIHLSNFTGILRNRFTIAHELGHYFLHYLLLPQDKRTPIKAKRFPPDADTPKHAALRTSEWEANTFASGFLMPTDDFIREFKTDPSIDALAAKFLVSRSAVEVRIKTLGDRL